MSTSSASFKTSMLRLLVGLEPQALQFPGSGAVAGALQPSRQPPCASRRHAPATPQASKHSPPQPLPGNAWQPKHTCHHCLLPLLASTPAPPWPHSQPGLCRPAGVSPSARHSAHLQLLHHALGQLPQQLL